MVMCTCGHAAATECELMSHFIESHSLSYDIALFSPLDCVPSLTDGSSPPDGMDSRIQRTPDTRAEQS